MPRVVEAVGYPRALEICLTGRAVGAVEARAIGLATAVVPATELGAAVADLVAALVAPPAAASRATAALVRSAVRNDPEAQDAAERAAQVQRLHEFVGGR
jgi:enoyl-CoA hydratase/carnithine racemase